MEENQADQAEKQLRLSDRSDRAVRARQIALRSAACRTVRMHAGLEQLIVHFMLRGILPHRSFVSLMQKIREHFSSLALLASVRDNAVFAVFLCNHRTALK